MQRFIRIVIVDNHVWNTPRTEKQEYLSYQVTLNSAIIIIREIKN